MVLTSNERENTCLFSLPQLFAVSCHLRETDEQLQVGNCSLLPSLHHKEKDIQLFLWLVPPPSHPGSIMPYPHLTLQASKKDHGDHHLVFCQPSETFTNIFIVLSICLSLACYTLDVLHTFRVLETFFLNGHASGFEGRGLSRKGRMLTHELIHS